MNIGIVGLGLIGSSLALKLAEIYNDINIYGEDISKSNLNYAIENTIIDKEGKLIIPCSVANSIYSIVSLYGGASKKTNWTKVARTYNVLSIEKMPIGIMTSKLAEYIYRYAIDKRKKQLKRMKNK